MGGVAKDSPRTCLLNPVGLAWLAQSYRAPAKKLEQLRLTFQLYSLAQSDLNHARRLVDHEVVIERGANAAPVAV